MGVLCSETLRQGKQKGLVCSLTENWKKPYQQMCVDVNSRVDIPWYGRINRCIDILQTPAIRTSV